MALILIISRMLGPEIFGGYSFMNAVIITGIVVSNFGLDTYFVRETSRDNNIGKQLLSSVFGFKIISSLLVMACVFVVFNFILLDRYLVKLLLIYSIVICLNSLSQSFWYYGNAFQKFQFHAGLWAFSNIIKVPIVWIFILIEPKLLMIVYALILSEIISLIVSGCTVRKYFNLNIFNVKFDNTLPLLRKVWPLAIICILSVLYFRIDLLMLQVIKGEKAVGIYSASYKLIEFLTIIPGTVTVAALPGLVADYSNNLEGFRTSFYRVITALGVSGAAIGLILYIFSKQIILLLYGALFFDSILSLNILSGVVFFLFVNGYLAYITIATNNDRAVVGILVVSTTLNVLLNYYLIPIYSHAGAAISTLISEIVMFLLYIVLFAKKNIFLNDELPQKAAEGTEENVFM